MGIRKKDPRVGCQRSFSWCTEHRLFGMENCGIMGTLKHDGRHISRGLGVDVILRVRILIAYRASPMELSLSA